jgi:hypothetical protein
MFFSRIWMLLLTIATIVLTVAFLLAPRPAEYQLNASLEKQLDVAQGFVDLHLRNIARKRLDVLSNMGKEPKIVKPLLALQGKASAGEEAEKQRGLLSNALKRANKKSGFRAKTLAVTDRKGKVRARIGAGGKVDDSLAGLPEIKAALRGVCLDNTVMRGSKLYWVYVCPARYIKLGEKRRLAGTIRAEVEIDNAFVTNVAQYIGASKTAGEEKDAKKKNKDKDKKDALSIELCFFAQGRPVAWTQKTNLWADHGPRVYKKHQKTISDKSIGRSPAVVVKSGKDKFLMVLGRLRGGASGSGNFWAILWKFPAALGPLAFLSGQTPRSHLLKDFPYVLVIGGGVLALLLGMFFIFWEGDRPLSRLLKQGRAVAAGEREKFDESKFRGRYSLCAIAINEGLENAAEQASPKPALHEKDLNEIMEPAVAQDDYAPPPPEAVAGKPETENEPAPLGSVLPPEPPAPPKKDTAAKSGPPPFGGNQGIRPSTFGEQPPPASKSFAMEAAVGGPPPAPTGDSPEGIPPNVETHFKEVFETFVQKKQECGENVASLTYEKFRNQLTRSRKQILDTQECVDVRFQVYVKDGKAALKAQPVKS